MYTHFRPELPTVETLKANGGFTYALDHTTGWMVGLTGYEYVLPLDDLTDQHILDYFTCVLMVLYAHEENYFGAWIDDDEVYFDVSRWVETEEEAHCLGKFHNQLSIYNLETQEVEDLQ